MATKKDARKGVPPKRVKKRKELDQYDKIFNEIDLNNDGRISVLELTKAARIIGINPTKKEAEKMIADIQPEESGYVTRHEFKRLFEKRDELIIDEVEKIKEAFRVFDKDGSGTISADEIRQVMQCCGETLDQSTLDEMMSMVDADGDGNISIEEFANVMCDVTE